LLKPAQPLSSEWIHSEFAKWGIAEPGDEILVLGYPSSFFHAEVPDYQTPRPTPGTISASFWCETQAASPGTEFAQPTVSYGKLLEV